MKRKIQVEISEETESKIAFQHVRDFPDLYEPFLGEKRGIAVIQTILFPGDFGVNGKLLNLTIPLVEAAREAVDGEGNSADELARARILLRDLKRAAMVIEKHLAEATPPNPHPGSGTNAAPSGT